MNKILLALAIFIGGGCSSQLNELKTKVVDLEAQTESLSQDKHDLCATTVEIMTRGVFIYIGNDTYAHVVTGEQRKFEGLIKNCDEMLEGFREAVKSRNESLTPLGETSQPSE